MKIGYASTAALLLCGSSVLAQRVGLAPAEYRFGKLTKAQPKVEAASQGSAKIGGDVVFGEDFANGLAGNNGIGAWTTSGADGALWLADSDGPNGDFSDPSEIIVSPTVSNGFMIFDSNLSNPGAVSNNRIGGLVSPPLDLSATPNVHIEFHTKLRWCCTGFVSHWLEVSTDGGASWPTRFDLVNNAVINTDIHTNEDIGTHKHRINLTEAISANPSNVKFRFNHECYDCTTGSTSHYHWQVDDVSVIENFGTDVALVSTQYDQYPDQGDADLEYSVYPFSQLRELNLRAHIRNGGTNAATNVTLTGTVTGDVGGQVFNQSGSLASLAVNGRDSITIDGFTPAQVADDYTVAFALTSDGTDSVADNTNEKTFSVHPYWYGLDDGALDNRADNAGEAFMMANAMFIENDATLYAIDVCVANSGAGSSLGTTVGIDIQAHLLDENLEILETTETHTVAANERTGANQAKWIHLVFDQPVQLTGQTAHAAALDHFATPDNVAVACSGWSIPQTSFIFDGAQSSWFWQSETPMIRMNFDPAVGIHEEAARELALRAVPSVFNENTTVRFMHGGGNASWILTDITGRLISSVNMGNMGSGLQSFNIDGNELAQGQYLVRVVSNGVAASVKLVKAAN